MKSKKIISLLLASLMLLSVIITGCGNGGSETTENKSGTETTGTSGGSGKTSVTFWTLSTRQEALDEIVESFNAANDDVEVTISYYDTDGIKDACKVAASSGTLPNMWFNWGGSLGRFYVDNGATYDLTAYAKENGWSDIFTSGSLSLCTFDDQLAGYPTSYSVLNVYYRKDIFEQYGLEVPTTFEEFEEICATLKENGVTPISTAGLNGWHVMRFVELLVEYYAGEETHDALSTFDESWDNEYVIQALTKYKEFCEKGYFPDGFVTANPDDTRLAMMTGECAMDIQGQWYDGQILSDGGDLSLFGTFALPTSGTSRVSAFAEMTQFNANNSAEELEACMRFMDYYYNDENVEQYADFYNLPLPKIGSEAPEKYINIPTIMETAETNGTFTITDQAFPSEVADGLFNVQDAVANGEMTPEEGAAAIQAAVEAYQSK